MVINGLTYDSVGNRILLKYNSLDATRGGTTINRYTIDDIWETVLANNWTDYVVKTGNSYFFKLPFIIEDCYVKFEMLLSNTCCTKYNIFKFLFGVSGVHYKECQKEHSFITAL